MHMDLGDWRQRELRRLHEQKKKKRKGGKVFFGIFLTSLFFVKCLIYNSKVTRNAEECWHSLQTLVC